MSERVKDRRKHPRVPAQLGARVTAGEDGFEATVKNISESGVLLVASKPLSEMTMVRMRVLLPPRPGEGIAFTFEISGAVVRCEKAAADPAQYELAVFLTNMPREAKSALADFVSARMGG